MSRRRLVSVAASAPAETDGYGRLRLRNPDCDWLQIREWSDNRGVCGNKQTAGALPQGVQMPRPGVPLYRLRGEGRSASFKY